VSGILSITIIPGKDREGLKMLDDGVSGCAVDLALIVQNLDIHAVKTTRGNPSTMRSREEEVVLFLEASLEPLPAG
jgi:hypothetical protein